MDFAFISKYVCHFKMKKMKAVFCRQYGGPEVLEIKDIPRVTPDENEVIIRNHAASITTADTFLRKGEPKFGRLFLGWSKPKQPMVGTGFAGVIEEVGSKVSAFKAGDKVYGETVFGFGANAEYVRAHVEKSIIRKLPEQMSFEQAACMCDGVLTSYNFLKDLGKLSKGQHVLINGASGALGTAGIQIAKCLGAHVTAVCSGKNEAWIREIGADHVIDYHQEDFTMSNDSYDLVYDSIGKSTYSKTKRLLKKGGAYLSPVLSLPLLITMIGTSIASSKKARFEATGLKNISVLHQFLEHLELWVIEGKLQVVMDKTYPIEDIVEAHRYVDSGRKKGNLTIQF